MKVFFADTFYWIALTNPKDAAHREVMEFSSKLGPRSVITTDEVLTELLAYCASSTKLRREVGLAVLRLQHDPDIRVVPQTRNGFLDGLTLYNARPDKGYSLTDCISMQTRREGIAEALTNDRHFEQEGFRALFRAP
ncbi:MAG TPA: PIN domain-containing protein [Bryobacteraceae bacterium]